MIAAQTDQAECLRLAPGDSLQRTVRVRYLEQAPISHLLSYIPTEIAAGFDKRRMAHYTVTELLTAAGHTVAAVTQRFVAIAAESELAQRLDVQIGTPLLRIERVAYDAQDVPLQLLYATYATERYRPSIRLAGHSATENSRRRIRLYRPPKNTSAGRAAASTLRSCAGRSIVFIEQPGIHLVIRSSRHTSSNRGSRLAWSTSARVSVSISSMRAC